MSTVEGGERHAPGAGSEAPPQPSLARRLRHLHPGVVLAVLDLIGIAVAIYLSTVELQGEVPYCGPLHGCETVAQSSYSHIAGLPVAVLGVGFSLVLLGLAVAWWRSGDRRLLAGHYGLSLVGVIFVAYLTYLELFVIQAICVWCVSFAASVVLGFLVALVAWVRTPA